jgi:hypothetical protein
VGRRNEQPRARGADRQAGQNSLFVADALHQPSGRKSRQKISAKKSGLNQRRLQIRQLKRLLEMGNQYVVEVDTEGPQEKQAGDENEGRQVAALG